MSFLSHLKSIDPVNETVAGDIAAVDSKLSGKPEKRKRPKAMVSEDTAINRIVQLFKKNNIKIKLVNPTPFGLQIDLFKKANFDDITEVLSKAGIDLPIKVKSNSVFIEI